MSFISKLGSVFKQTVNKVIKSVDNKTKKVTPDKTNPSSPKKIQFSKTNENELVQVKFDDYIKNPNKKISFSSKSVFKKSPVKETNNIKNDGSFEKETYDLMNEKRIHKTKLLDVAQDHLGISEVSLSEYKKMSEEEKENTQMHIIKGYGVGANGGIDDQWCAHTVSHLLRNAGIEFGGHKPAVSQFIEWGTNNGRYKAIKSEKMTSANYQKERTSRKEQLEQQAKNMNEGDLIIWKNSYKYTTQYGMKDGSRSHIGIIESVDLKKGTITVIEGNANLQVNGTGYDKVLVEQGEIANGNQTAGSIKEVNKRDGLIRQVHNIDDLAYFGYSGYIDMKGLV